MLLFLNFRSLNNKEKEKSFQKDTKSRKIKRINDKNGFFSNKNDYEKCSQFLIVKLFS